jgi:hypothetical protein
MKPANPVSEDMFEKARLAFFGTPKSLPKEGQGIRTDPARERVDDTARVQDVVTA